MVTVGTPPSVEPASPAPVPDEEDDEDAAIPPAPVVPEEELEDELAGVPPVPEDELAGAPPPVDELLAGELPPAPLDELAGVPLLVLVEVAEGWLLQPWVEASARAHVEAKGTTKTSAERRCMAVSPEPSKEARWRLGDAGG